MKEIELDYDKEADVLYISLGKSRKGVGEELNDWIVKRVDPETHEVLGFTIINFSKVIAEDRLLKLPIELTA